MVIDCMYLPAKNGIKWNRINKSMSLNDCPNIRRRFQFFFLISRHVLNFTLYILMVEFNYYRNG